MGTVAGQSRRDGTESTQNGSDALGAVTDIWQGIGHDT